MNRCANGMAASALAASVTGVGGVMRVLDPGRKRDRTQLSVVVALAMASAVALAIVTLGGPSSAEASSLARFETAGQTKWTVPAGVQKIAIDVYGGSGGHYVANNTIEFTGGLGGEAKGTFTVTPGEVLLVVVGGRGSDSKPEGGPEGGGYNGGGRGGKGGGYGGGSSAVEVGGQGNSCASHGACSEYDRIIVGGGGGGASEAHNGANGGGRNGAGPNAAAGQEPVDVVAYCNLQQDYFGECFYMGGNGRGVGDYGYAGGGGGWFGGFGAANANQGGGGGSGYVSPFAISASFPGGTHAGDGLVVIKAA